MLMGQAEDDLIQKITKELEENLFEVQLFAGRNRTEVKEYIKEFRSCDAVILVE